MPIDPRDHVGIDVMVYLHVMQSDLIQYRSVGTKCHIGKRQIGSRCWGADLDFTRGKQELHNFYYWPNTAIKLRITGVYSAIGKPSITLPRTTLSPHSTGYKTFNRQEHTARQHAEQSSSTQMWPSNPGTTILRIIQLEKCVVNTTVMPYNNVYKSYYKLLTF